jgi:hypothetical protein
MMAATRLVDFRKGPHALAALVGTEYDGDNWAVIASLIKNGKLSGINAHDWLTETLTKLANGHPANAFGDLMSWTTVGRKHHLPLMRA